MRCPLALPPYVDVNRWFARFTAPTKILLQPSKLWKRGAERAEILYVYVRVPAKGRNTLKVLNIFILHFTSLYLSSTSSLSPLHFHSSSFKKAKIVVLLSDGLLIIICKFTLIFRVTVALVNFRLNFHSAASSPGALPD